LVEQRNRNPHVGGSSPLAGSRIKGVSPDVTKLYRASRFFYFFHFHK
jgi:hypothetical protein